MSARTAAALLLAAAALSSILAPGWPAFALDAAGALALLAGLLWKRPLLAPVAGALMYIPLGWALSLFLPEAWGFLASGVFFVAACESQTFGMEVSLVLSSPTGVDAETQALAVGAAAAHSRKMARFVALTAVVLAGTGAASLVTEHAAVLIAATVLLMTALLVFIDR
jgi:hypothetical protein